MNFYANWTPIQEMSDWFGHWSEHGTKPLFTCEFCVPMSWDWTMYRGWYKGSRSFGSAVVPWEFCMAEWNAQLLGDEAFKISELEKRNLRWETPEEWLGIAGECGELQESRPGKQVWMGERYREVGIDETPRIVFCVTLRTIDADAPIRKKVSRRRSRSVMQDLVYLACFLVRHALCWTLSFGRNCPWLKTWRWAYLRFEPT